MNYDEKICLNFLRSINDGEIPFEPFQNQPPDFVVDGKVGVEVRRLNQNYHKSNGQYEGLEELSIPLYQKLKKKLQLFPSEDGENWYVSIDFKREFNNSKKMWIKIKEELTEFRTNLIRTEQRIKINENFSIEFNRSFIPRDQFFVLGGFDDENWDGWYISTLIKNLKVIITEKEGKVEPHFHKYDEWWLVVVDYIHGSLNFEDSEIETIKENIPKSDFFKKVIIIEKTLVREPLIIEW